MVHDPLDHLRLRDEGKNAHLGSIPRTHQRVHLVHPPDQVRPPASNPLILPWLRGVMSALAGVGAFLRRLRRRSRQLSQQLTIDEALPDVPATVIKGGHVRPPGALDHLAQEGDLLGGSGEGAAAVLGAGFTPRHAATSTSGRRSATKG
jgi:hypothetical protein